MGWNMYRSRLKMHIEAGVPIFMHFWDIWVARTILPSEPCPLSPTNLVSVVAISLVSVWFRLDIFLKMASLVETHWAHVHRNRMAAPWRCMDDWTCACVYFHFLVQKTHVKSSLPLYCLPREERSVSSLRFIQPSRRRPPVYTPAAMPCPAAVVLPHW